jgi:hypothetical protein
MTESSSKVTMQMVEAKRRLVEALGADRLNLGDIREAARVLREAQKAAGWSQSDSRKDALELIGPILYGPMRALGIDVATAIADGFGIVDFELESHPDERIH